MKKEKPPIIFDKPYRALVKIKKSFLNKYKSKDNLKNCKKQNNFLKSLNPT